MPTGSLQAALAEKEQMREQLSSCQRDFSKMKVLLGRMGREIEQLRSELRTEQTTVQKLRAKGVAVERPPLSSRQPPA